MISPHDALSKHTIVVCADDYGIEPGVNEAIVELAQLGRLSATSCLTHAPHFAEHAGALQVLDIDVGLHINFTESLGAPGQYQPLPTLILSAYLRKLGMQDVYKQISEQLDTFEHHMGRAPDFMDGHLHVHQLPVIRDALMRILTERYRGAMPWVRNTQPGKLSSGLPFKQRVKAHIIGFLGANALSAQAKKIGVPMNRNFFGAYDFSQPHPPYAAMLDAWMQHAGRGSLIMTHPAKFVSDQDVFGQDRIQEYRVLGSELFLALLDQYQLEIGKLSELNAQHTRPLI